MAKRTPTPQELNEMFCFDPATGILKWKIRRSNRTSIGAACGCPDGKGYLQVRIFKRLFFIHRVAWAMTHGKWPDQSIDHINGNGCDNRLGNLREATLCQNLQNQRLSTRNKSGVKGVSWCKQRRKWVAKFTSERREIHVGFFTCINDAKAAVQAKRESIHGEFARHA